MQQSTVLALSGFCSNAFSSAFFVRRFRLFRMLAALLILFIPLAPAAAAGKAGPPKVVLALGDSLTAGYGLSPADSFPAQLQVALGQRVRVLNAGVSGDTTAQALARLDWVLAGAGARPDLAIVALGANDMLRGLTVAQTEKNLAAIVATLQKRRVKVLLAGMLAAPNMGAKYQREFNAIYPALSKKYKTAFYPFFLKGVTGNPKLLLRDGMHPNRAGVRVMVHNILPVVEKALR